MTVIYLSSVEWLGEKIAINKMSCCGGNGVPDAQEYVQVSAHIEVSRRVWRTISG